MKLEIPLEGEAINAHQDFTAQLGDNEITFRLDFQPYRKVPSWNVSLFKDGDPLVLGLVLTGGCDLLSPYHLDIGSLSLEGDEPTLDNIGISNKLIWTSEDEKVRD